MEWLQGQRTYGERKTSPGREGGREEGRKGGRREGGGRGREEGRESDFHDSHMPTPTVQNANHKSSTAHLKHSSNDLQLPKGSPYAS